MSAMASQITGVSIICTTVCWGTDKKKHQSSASPAFARGIHQRPKGPVTRKMFPLDDVIMETLLSKSGVDSWRVQSMKIDDGWNLHD